MGRHAASPASDRPVPGHPAHEHSADASHARHTDGADAIDAPASWVDATAGARRPWWREALIFAIVGAVTTGAVLVWAVGEWWIAGLGAVGAAAVVVAATWAARSVPAPE